MKAKWFISLYGNNINVKYYNLVDGIIFDCGTTNKFINFQDLLAFAVNEGMADGDGVYVNGFLMFIYGDSHDNKQRTFCN